MAPPGLSLRMASAGEVVPGLKEEVICLLKGDIPVVLLMGESSDITEIDLSSIEDY